MLYDRCKIKTFANHFCLDFAFVGTMPFGGFTKIAYICKQITVTETTKSMMKYFSAVFFTILLITACGKHRADTQTDRLYQTLDSMIDRHDEFVAAKEAHIQSLCNGLREVALTPEQEYNMNLRLFDEYLAFRFDSAYYYINRNMQSPLAGADTEHYAVSAIRLAHILSVSGIFNNARMLLDSIQPASLSDETRVAFYNQRAELNLYRSEMAQYTPYFMEYIDSAQYYRQLLLQVAPKESFEYLLNHASYTCEKGDVEGAIRLFEQYLPTLQSGDRRYSIVASTLAYFYWKDKQPEKREHYLLLSAISDLRGAILENNALRELSTILMERGEYQRAYRYLQLASNDAQQYGSSLRSMQAARMAPLITKAYDAEREHVQQRTNRLLTILGIITFLLVCFILFTLQLLYKRRVANRKIRQMNTALTSHNEEMKTLNGQLSTLNTQMKEANRIKDEYIGRFLELCSTLIHSGEERLKRLNRLARDRKLEELYTEIKSNTPIAEGVRMFHQNFDTAFLNIYPDFISEVNRLMMPDNQFELDGDSTKLTTELRVLALIRLGIVDNQKIADILRSSITTIYTYRSKLKARALQKDTFEDDIRKIATY